MTRPLALGYLRLPAADPAETGAALTAEIRAYADREGWPWAMSTPTRWTRPPRANSGPGSAR